MLTYAWRWDGSGSAEADRVEDRPRGGPGSGQAEQEVRRRAVRSGDREDQHAGREAALPGDLRQADPDAASRLAAAVALADRFGRVLPGDRDQARFGLVNAGERELERARRVDRRPGRVDQQQHARAQAGSAGGPPGFALPAPGARGRERHAAELLPDPA